MPFAVRSVHAGPAFRLSRSPWIHGATSCNCGLRRLIFFVYVNPLVYGIWLSDVLVQGHEVRVSAGVYIVLSALSIVLVIPYFQYVFVFLQPRHIIERIERSIETSLSLALQRPGQVERARGELFVTESREFWEIEDRGVSFYYVEASYRESVHEFFAWLLGERPLPRARTQST